MTRDEARAAFRDAGITYKALAPETLDNLRRSIDERMKEYRALPAGSAG